LPRQLCEFLPLHGGYQLALRVFGCEDRGVCVMRTVALDAAQDKFQSRVGVIRDRGRERVARLASSASRLAHLLEEAFASAFLPSGEA